MVEYFYASVSTAGLMAFVLFLFRNLIITRLKGAVEHEYNSKIEKIKTENSIYVEEIKASLSHQATLLSLSHKSLGEYAMPFHIKRLEESAKLWNGFLKIDNSLPGVIVGLVDVLLPNEYAPALERGTIWLVSSDDLMKGIDETMSFESSRPFVGEYLWNFFFAYRAFIIRVGIHYSKDFLKNKTVTAWFDDKKTMEILSSILDPSEMELVQQSSIGKLNLTQRMCRAKFAIAVGVAASGIGDTDSQLATAKKIAAAAA